MDKKIVTVNTLKVGSYVIIDDVPCIVTDIRTSSPGKHGSAKANITAKGIIDGKKRSIIKGTGDDIEVPIIHKRDAQVLSVERGERVVATVMDMETYETFEIEVPEEFRDKVEEGKIVYYWDVMGARILKQVKG